MSGLMSALGQGISAAGYGAGDLYAKQSLVDQQSNVEFERQRRLLEFKASMDLQEKQGEYDMADQQRAKMVSRVDAKAGEMADEQLAPTRGLIDSGITDRSSWTPEQQAAVDQSIGGQRAKLKSQLHTDAAIATGDITPKDAASVEYKNEALLYKDMLERLKEDGRNDRVDAQEEGRTQRSDTRMAAMMAAIDKRQAGTLEAIDRRAAARDSKGGDKENVHQMLGIVENTRKEIASHSTETRQLYQDELKSAVGPTAKKAVQDKWQPKFDDLDRQRKAADADYDFLRQKVGMPKSADTSAPATAVPAVPPGKPAAAPKSQQRSDISPDRQDNLAASAPAPPQFKSGETRVVAAGPNKGKTVTWDGTGWKL